MPRVGDKRYVCFVNPVARIEAAAREEGWDGEGSPGDYTDLLGHECGKAFSTRAAAIRWGEQYVAEGKDYFGAARVYEQIFGPDEDIPELPNAWHSGRGWEVVPGEEPCDISRGYW